MTSKPMKVRITLTIEVDPTDWSEYYGTSTPRSAVADDVRGYVLNAIQQAPAPFRAVKAVR